MTVPAARRLSDRKSPDALDLHITQPEEYGHCEGVPPMIDHVSIAVSDLQGSAAFYEQVLEPLGLRRLVERERTVGFGKSYPEFWLNLRPTMPAVGDDTGSHVCLRATSKEAVTIFYERAIRLGGRGDGEPRDRQAAMTVYFGAFIRDLDGNKIEALTIPRKD
jgi:catechol 2,3-dioxygenase-like lactoylglutathione lyase family enzyme